MTSKPEQPVDERLSGAHDLALAALHEITAADTVGPAAGYTAEDGGAVSLRFHTRLAGYPGWFWTVSVAVVDDSEPTVLEVELLPGDGALLAPDWVPWATRLAEYQAAQVAAAVESDDDEDDDTDEDVDDLDDEADDDEDEDEDEPKARFHAGDLDGVDIDELDAGHAESDANADDDSDDEDDADDDFDDDDDEGDRSY
ncbi:DNA primase [Rhodococcus sp. 06-1477-1B]|nr:DNA primase [Rhodococcus sp. 06-1477-1B]